MTSLSRTSKYVVLAWIIGCSLTAVSGAHDGGASSADEKASVLENKVFAKGGIGIVAPGLYIETKSSENAIILGDSRWAGENRAVRQVVLIWRGNVYGLSAVPDGFSLKESVLISFEREKVYFFDYRRGDGAYYSRPMHDD